MEVYFDEKWKLSKKGSRREHSRREQQLHPHQQGLKRSSSMPESLKGVRRTTTTNLKRSQSSKSATSAAPPASRSFSSRCANLVKEQRAKFYIMRRCVTMLICWRDYP